MRPELPKPPKSHSAKSQSAKIPLAKTPLAKIPLAKIPLAKIPGALAGLARPRGHGTGRARAASGLMVLLGAWASCGGAARAQGLLPATGPDLRVGDLRDQFQQAFGAVPAAEAHSWTFVPSLDLSETFDDGVLLRNGGYGTDLVTRVAPGITISGDSSRLQGDLTYAPALSVYAKNGNLNSVAQNLNASATATLVPDLLFLDLRGYAAQQAIYGGQGPNYSYQQSGQTEAQTMSYSATPRLEHRFGGTGTATASYTYTRNIIDADVSTQQNAYLSQGNFSSQQENASFTTGEDFGQLQDTLSALALQYTGSGALSGAHREVFQDSASYALSRLIALTGSIGHENIVYGPGGGVPIDDVTWSVGATLTPNADTSIQVSYGRQQGATSASLNASLAPTSRTRVYATYSQGVGSQQEGLQNALQNSVVNANGVTVDRTTGVPIQVANNFYGIQTGIYRTTRASLTGVVLYDRDTVTLELEHDDYVLLSSANAGNIGSNSGEFGSVAWSHSVSEALTANLFLQYGTRNISGGGGNQDSLTFSVSGNYIISATLNASAQYTRTQINGNTFGQPTSHDVATVSLHKTF
jgi:uncharacterized protein (PEP-CTERM system associated)